MRYLATLQTRFGFVVSAILSLTLAPTAGAQTSEAVKTVKTLEVHKHFFGTRGEALDDLEKTGFWPTTFVSEPSPAGAIHWHDLEVHGYVVEGRTWFLDVERGVRHDVASGDKIVVPARTLHAEGEITENVIYIISLPEPGPFDPFLEQLSPDDLEK